MSPRGLLRCGQAQLVFFLEQRSVLVRVNNVAISGGDLLGFSEKQHSLSPGMYEYLLQRAIDRELTEQAARAQGVKLTEEQARKVADLRPKGATTPSFQERDVTSQMLLTALAEKVGAPSPFVGREEIERYYREHQAEFEELPSEATKRSAAWREVEISIRQALFQEHQSAYHQFVRTYLDRLRIEADISAGT